MREAELSKGENNVHSEGQDLFLEQKLNYIAIKLNQIHNTFQNILICTIGGQVSHMSFEDGRCSESDHPSDILTTEPSMSVIKLELYW